MTSTTTSQVPAGQRSFLQKRLALLGAVLGVIHVLGLTFQAASTLAHGALNTPIYLMAAAAAISLGLLVVARGPVRPTGTLRVIEGGMLLVTAMVIGLIGHAVPSSYLPLLIDPEGAEGALRHFAALRPTGAYVYVSTACIIAATHVFVLRAALVPSSARRTLGLTIAGGVVLGGTFALPIPWWAADRALWAALPAGSGFGMATITAVWWAMTTIVCVVLSKVIHGLRREIRSARRLGQYQLEAKLGEGGMGVVYRAQHALLRRPTAIKLLQPDKVGEDSLARFEREVQLTATLTHPNTITIFDYGRTPDGVFYYAMELLDGASLGDVVALDGPQPPGRVVHVLRAMAGALQEAHGRGLVHRDVKPGNIVLCDHGGEPDVPMLLDFGLVKRVDGGADVAVTQAHTITGTPAYLAPEVIRSADAATAASDLYALGAVAYFMVTATHVFEGGTVVEVCAHHLHTPPEPPSELLGDEVPASLEQLILQMLDKDPAARPPSARAVLDRLEALEGVGPWTLAKRTAWWDAHGAALRAQAPAPASGTADTVFVDMRAR
ncbi:MAG: protein kinase [Sandaracinaceae bacterium]|nr:protein kinase [Sandaracinaceae bacterium]